MASSELPRALQLAPTDNVVVALADLSRGATIDVAGVSLSLRDPIKIGHKFALREIAAGERILKYNCPIGSATRRIEAGESVHTHNVRSDYLANTTPAMAVPP